MGSGFFYWGSKRRCLHSRITRWMPWIGHHQIMVEIIVMLDLVLRISLVRTPKLCSNVRMSLALLLGYRLPCLFLKEDCGPVSHDQRFCPMRIRFWKSSDCLVVTHLVTRAAMPLGTLRKLHARFAHVQLLDYELDLAMPLDPLFRRNGQQKGRTKIPAEETVVVNSLHFGASGCLKKPAFKPNTS